jgi:flavin reductase (DIM6/NTAB) family NADH-FMN oxidoreductase RutF
MTPGGTPASLRRAVDALANTLPAGVAVVTTSGGGRPHGTTVRNVQRASTDPPLVAVTLSRTSALLARLRQGGRLGVNVLAAHQDQVALRFSKTVHDRFADIAWSDAGAPRLDGIHAWALADVQTIIPAGDHAIVLADVLESEVIGGAPLAYWQRSFGTVQPF